MFLRRLVSVCAAGLVSFAFLSGCSSSRAGMPLVPTQSVSGSQVGTKHWVRPKSELAFPIDILAFNIDILGLPIDWLAYSIAACGQASGTSAACHVQYRSDITPNPGSNPGSIPGYHPSDLQSAYGVTAASSSQGRGQTVAIVVAYQHSAWAVANDLNTYRTAFGLPPCNVSNGCLKTANLGQPCWFNSTCLQAQQAWAIEARIDAEVVSAICPNCNLLIVGAADNGLTNLGQAVQYAAQHGATVISNSYSVPEASGMSSYASYWNTPGVPNVVGAGDQGYGPGFPASAPNVIAVGGTSMINLNGSWVSKVWGGTGSGCSSFAPKPSWQTDSGCPMRTVNDVSAVADPATGVTAYVSAVGGWTVFGGTSISAPIVAAMYALAGNAGSISNASSLYANAASFAQVLPEPNGTCSVGYLCDNPANASGYNAPSGVGTPAGLAGF
jgi:subtilase family serine protease